MPKDQFCSVGLLSFALNGETSSSNLGECADVLANVIREQFPDRVAGTEDNEPTSVIIGFNDHSDTTWDDVERVFEKAEVAWDERL